MEAKIQSQDFDAAIFDLPAPVSKDIEILSNSSDVSRPSYPNTASTTGTPVTGIMMGAKDGGGRGSGEDGGAQGAFGLYHSEHNDEEEDDEGPAGHFKYNVTPRPEDWAQMMSENYEQKKIWQDGRHVENGRDAASDTSRRSMKTFLAKEASGFEEAKKRLMFSTTDFSDYPDNHNPDSAYFSKSAPATPGINLPVGVRREKSTRDGGIASRDLDPQPNGEIISIRQVARKKTTGSLQKIKEAFGGKKH